METLTDVTKASQAGASSTPKEQGDNTVKQDVKTQSPGVYADGGSLQKALKAERDKKRDLQAELDSLKQKMESKAEVKEKETEPIDDYEKTLSGLKKEIETLKARSEVSGVLKEDTFVKDNLDLIEREMTEKNVDIKTATKDVKARVLDRILSEASSSQINPPKQIQPKAVEEEQQELKGSTLDNVMAGNVKVDPALLATLKKYRPQ